MKRLSAFFLFFTISYHSIASTSPVESVIAPLAHKSLLLDINYVSDTKLVSVGQHGHILFSVDGDNWQQANVPVQSTLTSVFFVDRNNGWVVGHDATILATKDGGTTWEIQQFLPELERPLFDVVFKNDKQGIAIGAYGQFYRTEDGGETWVSEFHNEFLHPEDVEYLEELKQEDEEAYLDEITSILPHFNRVFRDGRTLYLVGEMGLIAKSNDFGKEWQKLDEIYQGSFFDITRTTQGNLLIAGLRGNTFRSLKNGTPWKKSDTGTTALINSIVLADEDRIFLVGNNGTLLESNDDGVTFVQNVRTDGKAYTGGVWFKDKLVLSSEVGIKTISVNK